MAKVFLSAFRPLFVYLIRLLFCKLVAIQTDSFSQLKDSDYSITTLPSFTSVWKSVCPGCSIMKSQRGSSKLC